MRLLILTASLFTLLTVPASAETANRTLAEQLQTETRGQGHRSCNLMSGGFQELYIQAAAVIGITAASCPEAVVTLYNYRKDRDTRFKSKASRQARAAQRGRVQNGPDRTTVRFSYQGLPPGWRGSGRGKVTREKYSLIFSGSGWLVEQLIYTRVSSR